MIRRMLVFLAVCLVGTVTGQSQTPETGTPGKPRDARPPLVTFVELGSVKCLPCRQMQPVMAAIGKKYGDQVAVVFHDVWKPEEHDYAERYGIRVIPTQVFLDANGKEFFRHEGFYPEAEIDRLLQKRGLKVRTGE